MKKIFKNKRNDVLKKLSDNNLGSLARIFLSSFIIIFIFYSLPLIANYTNDKILNTKEFRNNSKTVLAYTLDKQSNGKLDVNHLFTHKLPLEQVNKETEWADQQDNPSPNDVMKNMYIDNDPVNQHTSLKPKNVGDKVVLVDAINHALDEELIYNDKMMIYGEDVGGGKGGVFTATRGLTDKHGVDRVYNSPLAESSIVGTAIGLSTVGYKPVVEIQFADYIWTSMMQIRNELSTIRYRSNGDWSCPIVIRVPVGGYIHGGLCHSQRIEGYFAHLPGIKIAYPSNAEDAKGLLKTACRMSDGSWKIQ